MEVNKRHYKRVEGLDCAGVVSLLAKCDMTEFTEFVRARSIDGRKLLEITEGILKLWRPKCNAKRFLAFINDLKLNPDLYLNKEEITEIHPIEKEPDKTDTDISTTKKTETRNVDDKGPSLNVPIECQYQTVKKVKNESYSFSSVEDIIKRIVPAKSFLYRNQVQKNDKSSPSYLPMESTTPKKSRKLFRLSSYEYPFFDLKRFSKQEFNDRGYYSMKRNSRLYIQKTNKIPESRTKYKSLSTAEELNNKYVEEHFYEDLCYNDIGKNQAGTSELNRMSSTSTSSQVNMMVKIQELFQSFKLPFFKKTEEVTEEKRETNNRVNDKDANIYENSDSIANMYDSVHVNNSSDVVCANVERPKLPVEDYLEPVLVTKDYCDVCYKQKDESLLGYIMSIFETRFGIRKETDGHHSEDSEDSNHDASTEGRKWPEDQKAGRCNMADRPLPVPVENEPYYMNIFRSEAENLLKGQPDGTFLLRPSSQPNHAYTLSVACANAVHNIGVRRRPDGRLALGFARRGERSFATVASLLRHHRKRRLMLVANGDVIGGTTLIEPPQYYQTPCNIPVIFKCNYD